MKVSTRGRYALRVMTDLAEHYKDGFIPLKDVAERQEVSQKYLESIMLDLSKAGLVEGRHGKGGGYKLSRHSTEYTLLEILQVTEGELAPVACLESGAEKCSRAAECRTLPMWQELYSIISDFFASHTLCDLTKSIMLLNEDL